MKTIALCLSLICALSLTVRAQEILSLYPGVIPNSRVTSTLDSGSIASSGMFTRVTHPTLEVYLPEQKDGARPAVIICAGGSYKVIVYQGEGITTAKALAKNGVAAFVLKYRLPDDSTMVDKTIGPLQDVQQAMKMVRENAARWGIDTQKIGVMGFSAGGHLASTAATHYEPALIENANHTSLRPDFQILVYPVISMEDSLTHRDSRANLLGTNPSRRLIDLYSNELQVDEHTPPAYITHAADDALVDVDNSIAYFETLRHHHVSVELHVYPKGGHGFIFRHRGWMEPLLAWMKEMKLK